MIVVQMILSNRDLKKYTYRGFLKVFSRLDNFRLKRKDHRRRTSHSLNGQGPVPVLQTCALPRQPQDKTCGSQHDPVTGKAQSCQGGWQVKNRNTTQE